MIGHVRDDAAFSVLAVGNYAAQLAWWLQFFPADHFLIVSTAQLRDPVARLQARLPPPVYLHCVPTCGHVCAHPS